MSTCSASDLRSPPRPTPVFLSSLLLSVSLLLPSLSSLSSTFPLCSRPPLSLPCPAPLPSRAAGPARRLRSLRPPRLRGPHGPRPRRRLAGGVGHTRPHVRRRRRRRHGLSAARRLDHGALPGGAGDEVRAPRGRSPRDRPVRRASRVPHARRRVSGWSRIGASRVFYAGVRVRAAGLRVPGWAGCQLSSYYLVREFESYPPAGVRMDWLQVFGSAESGREHRRPVRRAGPDHPVAHTAVMVTGA